MEVAEYCSSDLCQNGGTCVNEVDGYKCICPPKYYGLNCEADSVTEIVEYCRKDSCKNGGTCVNDEIGFICLCDNDHYGDFCDEKYQTEGKD